jgi:NitT/TauT family transport system substrate-binding protein
MKTSALLRRLSLLAAALVAFALPASAADTAKPVLKIGHLPITDHLTVIAQGREQFKEFDLQLVKFSSWAELAEALKAGAVDGAYALTPISISLRQKGVPIHAVLLGHRNGSALTVRNSPDITSVADLKGRTIAIPNRLSTHNILLRKLLLAQQIDPEKDVKIIELAPPEMVNALSTSRIDAFIVAEPFGAQAELQKVGKVLLLSKDIWPDHICCVLNFREEAITQHPAAVQEFVAALVRTGAFIESHPHEAAVLSKQFLGQKPEVIEHVLTTPKGRVSFDNLIPTLADFTSTQDNLLKLGILKEGIDLTQYLDGRFAAQAVSATSTK